jgi:tetratricopeptide (TPR) repeat protein
MSEPFAIGVLAVSGLSWISAAAVAGVTGNASDRVLCSLLRGMRDRIAGLRRAPEGNAIARSIRIAQCQALERIINDYRSLGRPEWQSDPATRPDLFFERSLNFSRIQIGRCLNLEVKLNLKISDAFLEALDDILARPEDDGPPQPRSEVLARYAEDAVLNELKAALESTQSGSVRIPDGFVQHFRTGNGQCVRFIELFGSYIAGQLRTNEHLRNTYTSVQLARVHLGIRDTAEAVRLLQERFGPVLLRVELGIEQLAIVQHEQHNLLHELVERLRAEKGVPAGPLRHILAKMGEANVPLEHIPARLAAKADEYVLLRAQLSQDARESVVATIQSSARILLEEGDVEGARACIVTGRLQFRIAREQDAASEAKLIADEAALDRLQLRYRDAAAKYEMAGALVSFDSTARLQYLMQQGSTLMDHADEFGDTNALATALAIYANAASVVSRSDKPREWASAQNNLANALRELGKRERSTERLREAVGTYQVVLRSIKRKQDPELWAKLKNNLGKALRYLGERTGDAGLLKRAAMAHEAALRIRNRVATPATWAGSQNSLGIALFRLGEMTSEANALKRAVAAFKVALSTFTPERDPSSWAATQSNLAGALRALTDVADEPAYLDQALEGTLAALGAIERERFPMVWATLQTNVAALLWQLGNRTKDTELLAKAIATVREAVTIVSPRHSPLQWANMQNTLAVVLCEFGVLQRNEACFREAAHVLRAVLEELPRSGAPMLWAQAQRNLGWALLELGESLENVNDMEGALVACRAALGELTRDRAPLHWAKARELEGRIVLAIAKRTPAGQRNLGDAMIALSDALGVLQSLRMDTQAVSGMISEVRALSADLAALGAHGDKLDQ